MITPQYLRPGMKVGIVAPARKVSREEMEGAFETIRSWGLKPVEGRNLFRADRQFAGTHEERMSDFQEMLDDPEIRAVICARGGYGTVRLAGKLKPDRFLQYPKWIVGFSDVTVIHSLLNQVYQVETIHGPMGLHFSGEHHDPEGVESLRKVLFGERVEYTWPVHPLNITGNASGIITGGNLSVLYSLRGTPFDLYPASRILFIEDLEEYLYHIDRMMMNLKLGGWMEGLKGLIVGGMDRMNDNEIPFGKDAGSIVAEHAVTAKCPVAFGFPAGHLPPNMALVMGRKVRLEVAENQCRLRFCEEENSR